MATCVSQEGYKEAEEIRAEAMRPVIIAKTAFQTYVTLQGIRDAVEAYSSLNAIASETLAIEERDFAFNKSVYWRAEDQFFDEFFKAEPWEDEATLARRYEGRLWPPLANTFAKKINELRCNKPRYCTNAYIRAMQELEVTMAVTKTTVKTLAGQLAFAEVNGVAERNFDRRKAAYGLYKGLVAQASGFYASSASGFAAVGANAMGRVSSGINDLMYTFGRRGQEMQENEFQARTAAYAESRNGLDAAQQRNDLVEAESMVTGIQGRGPAFKASTSNDTNGALAKSLGPGDFGNTLVAGTGSNFARSGKITITHPGGTYNVVGGEGGQVTIPTWTATIDLDKLPLADVSGYSTDFEQAGPESMPGTPDGDVTYKDPTVK